MILNGVQPVGPNTFQNLSYPEEVDAHEAVWSDTTFEFFVLNKIKNCSAVVWRGGRIMGTFSPQTSWSRMHDAYAFSLDGTSEFTMVDVRIHNTGDGVSLKGTSPQAIFARMHLSAVRDDAFQNDWGQDNLIIEDCLVDGAYSFYSSRPYSATMPDHSGVIPTVIENCLARLVDMPTTYHVGMPGHAKFFKMDNASQAGYAQYGHPRDPKLALRNNILRVDTVHEVNTDFMIPPPDRCSESVGNVMVWGGAGNFPYPVYPGWTVTTDTSVWDNARAAWLEDHPLVAQEIPFP
jgi:hypothetical protein